MYIEMSAAQSPTYHRPRISLPDFAALFLACGPNGMKKLMQKEISATAFVPYVPGDASLLQSGLLSPPPRAGGVGGRPRSAVKSLRRKAAPRRPGLPSAVRRPHLLGRSMSWTGWQYTNAWHWLLPSIVILIVVHSLEKSP